MYILWNNGLFAIEFFLVNVISNVYLCIIEIKSCICKHLMDLNIVNI